MGSRYRAILVGLWLALAAIKAWSAPIQPPLRVLYDPLNLLIAGTLIEADPSGRLVFRRNEILHGESAPETVELMAPSWVANELLVGSAYLFAYSPFARDPQRVRTMAVNPKGPRLLSSPGLEPALYPDEPAYRAAFAYAEGGSIGGREDAVERMLNLLGGEGASLRVLAAAQLALDPALHARLDLRTVRILRKAVLDANMPWSARHWLYDLAVRKPELFGRRWLRRASREILAKAPVVGYGEPVNPGDLIGAVFLQTDLNRWSIREAALSRWLYSDSTAMIERALMQMRRQDPTLEHRSLAKALDDAGLRPKTRRFLEDHQRRLALMQSRQHGGGK